MRIRIHIALLLLCCISCNSEREAKSDLVDRGIEAEIQFEIATGVDHSLSAYKPKNLEEAIKLMEKAAKLTPSSWGVRQDLALYYWLRGDLEKAVENQRMSEELKRTN